MHVRVDGVDCTLVSASWVQVVVEVPTGKPGWSGIEISNALGAVKFAQAPEQWPSLDATLTQFQVPVLTERVHHKTAGIWLLGWSPQVLAQPIPIRPGASCGPLLDPSSLALLVAGQIPASGVAQIQFPVHLGGGPHVIPAQVLEFSDHSSVTSFTNLELATF